MLNNIRTLKPSYLEIMATSTHADMAIQQSFILLVMLDV